MFDHLPNQLSSGFQSRQIPQYSADFMPSSLVATKRRIPFARHWYKHPARSFSTAGRHSFQGVPNFRSSRMAKPRPYPYQRRISEISTRCDFASRRTVCPFAEKQRKQARATRGVAPLTICASCTRIGDDMDVSLPPRLREHPSVA